MKKKIVLWGNDAEDKKILIALELQERENKVHLHTFQESLVSESFYNEMMDSWRNGKEVEFPEGCETEVRELSVTSDILPETIKVQRADLINRAKAEWHFVVLSTKLYDLYSTELEDFKDKVTKLIGFDNDIWNEMRDFWSKISEQARERNLFREHADKLRDGANELFVSMKELKSKANEELAKVSKEQVGNFTTQLNEVKEKAEKGMSLGPLFDQLKKIQVEFKNADFTRNDRSKVWKKIDEAFKIVKEKKYGKAPEGQNNALTRLERRYQGLKSAIGKMEASIRRDKSDIDYHSDKAGRSMGQLEMQLREAKVKMVEERISSKQEKLDEMLRTKTDLEKRMEKEKVRAEKQAEKKAIAKKKAEIKEKMDATISDQANLSEEEIAKLKKATSALKESKQPKSTAAAAAGAVVAGAAAMTTDAKEAASAVTEKVEAKAVETKDAVSTKAAATKEAVTEKASEVKDVIVEKAETTIKQSEALVEKVKEESKAPVAQVQETVDTTIDKAKEVLAESKEAVAQKAESAKEAVADTAAKAKEVLAESKEAVAQKAESAKEAVADAAAEAKEVVTEKVAEAKGSTLADKAKAGGLLGAALALGSKVVDKVSDGIEDVADNLGVGEQFDKAKEAVSKGKDALTDKMEDLKESASEAVDSVKDKAADLKEESHAAVDGDGGEKKEGGVGSTMMKGGLLGAAVALGAKMVDKVSDGIESAAESVGLDDTLDKAKEKLSDLKDSASESVDKVADRVRQESPVDTSKLEKVGAASEEE
jgi:gas vesicle protein